LIDIILFFLCVLLGFFAQMIDGTIGMAYGVSSTSFLLSLGFAPAVASSSVHTAEVAVSFVSGLSHLKVGNVDKKLLIRLLIPGCVAATIGAYVLVNITIWFLKPAISIYLAVMGFIVLLRAVKKKIVAKKINVPVLAFIGGFVDAVGGGGWGPVVTTSLIANGKEPNKAIGTVNLSEFFVTVCETAAFFILIGIQYPFIVIALILGGVLAAPLGAIVCKKAPPKMLMVIVGIVIIALSIKNLAGV